MSMGGVGRISLAEHPHSFSFSKGFPNNILEENIMNPVIETILKRKSIRAYEKKGIEAEVRDELLRATLRAPTAGNLMLYSIVEVTDPGIKDTLVKTCDNQPFIARAPLVWLFLADYQRWFDYFIASGVEELCRKKKTKMRKPEEGDLFLACCDALIAAQTAVIAAESLGLGSCYIGDIMENYEKHRDLFNLPQYDFPICLVCFGYPTLQQINREQTSRFQEKFVLFENQYRHLSGDEFEEMFRETHEKVFHGREDVTGARNIGQLIYNRKFNAEFTTEMSRSVRAILKGWSEDKERVTQGPLP
jgi:nitroreductase